MIYIDAYLARTREFAPLLKFTGVIKQLNPHYLIEIEKSDSIYISSTNEVAKEELEAEGLQPTLVNFNNNGVLAAIKRIKEHVAQKRFFKFENETNNHLSAKEFFRQIEEQYPNQYWSLNLRKSTQTENAWVVEVVLPPNTDLNIYQLTTQAQQPNEEPPPTYREAMQEIAAERRAAAAAAAAPKPTEKSLFGGNGSGLHSQQNSMPTEGNNQDNHEPSAPPYYSSK